MLTSVSTPIFLCTPFSRTCLVWKRFTGTNKRRYIGLQPGSKSCRRPADKPLINRGSPAVFFSNDLHRNYFVRAAEKLFGTVIFDALEGARDGYFLREQTCRRPTLPSPPRPDASPCAARPDPPVVCPVYGDKKAPIHWSAAKNKERFSSRG